MIYGRTWWGKRWLRTLEALGLQYPDNRMSKGRTLVNKDAVDLLHVEPGELSAWVDEPRKSFGVSMQLPVFTSGQWRAFEEVMVSRLRNLAELMDDMLPTNIDRQLETTGLALFPSGDELTVRCPCSDRSRSCVHVIAMVHGFATEFDDDPFLLPYLRGRDRDALLSGIRDARPAISAATVHDASIPIDSLPYTEFFDGAQGLDSMAWASN